jgi:hypothetical protein
VNPAYTPSGSTLALLEALSLEMPNVIFIAVAFLTAAILPARVAGAQRLGDSDSSAASATTRRPFLTDPPKHGGPVVVRASFHLRDLNDIDDEAETFEFEGVLTLRWQDERQAFDPAELGVDEKVYQGDYQLNEVFSGWFPQLILVNASGLDEDDGVVLRVRQDGSLTLIQTINAAAEADLDLRRYPLDRQRLDVIFEVLGFDETEVLLQPDSESSVPHETVRIPQWTLENVSTAARSHPASYAGANGLSSVLVVSMEVKRGSSFMLRLVFFPLVLIVMLSWSVFWMERSSLADRINLSFIGILTAVAYQIMVSEIMPQISYMTLMTGFLNASFILMCLTVVINLVVAELDKRGKFELGDRVDKRCRWIFPLAYFGWIALMTAAAFIFF